MHAGCPAPHRSRTPSGMRSIHFLVSGLPWPDPFDPQALSELRLPALERLLARGTELRPPPSHREGWLEALWGYATGSAPFAALVARGAGLEPAGAIWMCADPIHLRAEGSGLRADSGPALRLDAADATALVAALNDFLAPDSIALHGLSAERWVANIPRMPDLHTVPTSVVQGRAVGPVMLRGGHAAEWMRRLTEAQMLMHEHPVNTTRERAGLPPVNSLWFWGPGPWAPPPVHPFDAVFSDDPLLRALASGAGIDSQSAPRDAGPAIGAATRGQVLVDYPEIGFAARMMDFEAWRTALTGFDEGYVGPALVALGAGMIDQILLTATDGPRGLAVRLGRAGLLRLWRRSVPLSKRFPVLSAPGPHRR